MKSDPIQLINRAEYEEPLNKAIPEKLELVFVHIGEDTWASIRELLTCETENAVKVLLKQISGLDLDQAKSNKLVQDLKDYARNVVETKAREEADPQKLLKRMKLRFAANLNDALVRNKDFKTIIKDACTECLRLLSVMAIIRLDWKPQKIEKKLFSRSKKQQDEIENILISTLMDEKMPSKTLASTTWPEVSPRDTLITPAKCKSLWKQFQAEILPQTQAFIAVEAAAEQAQKNLLVSALGLGISTAKVGAMALA